jgi:hypothetical protein
MYWLIFIVSSLIMSRLIVCRLIVCRLVVCRFVMRILGSSSRFSYYRFLFFTFVIFGTYWLFDIRWLLIFSFLLLSLLFFLFFSAFMFYYFLLLLFLFCYIIICLPSVLGFGFPFGFPLSAPIDTLPPPTTVDGFFLSTTGVGAGFLGSGWVGTGLLFVVAVPGLPVGSISMILYTFFVCGRCVFRFSLPISILWSMFRMFTML